MTTEANTPDAGLAPRDQDTVAKAEQAAVLLGAGSHLQDWLAVAEGLVVLRRVAMLRANSNEPAGKRYAAEFSKLMTKHQGLAVLGSKDVVSKAIWLVDGEDRRQALAAIMARMTAGQLARFNSPTTAYQRVKAELEAAAKVQAAEDESQGDDGRAVVEAPVAAPKLTPTQLLQARIVELEAANLALKARLASVDGQTIDLDQPSIVSDFQLVVSRFPAKPSNKVKLVKLQAIIGQRLVSMDDQLGRSKAKMMTPDQTKRAAKAAKQAGGAL